MIFVIVRKVSFYTERFTLESNSVIILPCFGKINSSIHMNNVICYIVHVHLYGYPYMYIYNCLGSMGKNVPVRKYVVDLQHTIYYLVLF